jgi:hypothetical protein
LALVVVLLRKVKTLASQLLLRLLAVVGVVLGLLMTLLLLVAMAAPVVVAVDASQQIQHLVAWVLLVKVMAAVQVTQFHHPALRVVQAAAVQAVVERTGTTHTVMVVSVLLTPLQDQPLVNWSAVSIGLLVVVGVVITMVLEVAVLE